VGIAALGAVTGGIGAGLFGIGSGTMFGGSIFAGIFQGAAMGFSVGNTTEELMFHGERLAKGEHIEAELP
jgi:hypothetical protein